MHIESGWVPSTTRVEEFEAAIRSVCEPIFDKPLKDISFGLLLLRLFQTARRFDMVVQPQLVLLQKTQLPEMPNLIFHALQSNAQMQQQIQLHNLEMQALRQQLQRNNRRTLWTIATSTALICATLLMPMLLSILANS